MQKFAELTGRPQDKAYYAELGENIKNGFNRRFYRSEDGYYDNGELTSNLLPVAFGMVPAEELPRVTAYVGDLVEVKNQGPPEYGRHRHPMADENAFGHRPSGSRARHRPQRPTRVGVI